MNLTRKTYFAELREQLLDVTKWDSNHFIVFNHECGTGKTQETLRILGEMTQKYDYRVLYVQLFVKDEQLDNTVNTINYYAGRQVAERYAKEDTKSKIRHKRALDSQILCITHRRYAQICRGENQELLQDRSILIIDEHPNLMEKIKVSRQDIGTLFASKIEAGREDADQIAMMFREKLNDCCRNSRLTDEQRIAFVDFSAAECNGYMRIMDELMKTVSNKEQRELLDKFKQIFKNGSAYLYEDSFQTYDTRYDYVLLQNNIILDANGFDARYKLSNKFKLKNQERFYDYSNSTLYHYSVDTGKRGLSRLINFFESVLNSISFEGCKGALFITDKESKEELERCIAQHFSHIGDTLEEIEERLGFPIAVDYHGNLLGVNRYRDFNIVVVLKTPNFSYLAYVMNYLFLKAMDNQPHIGDITVFQNQDVEELRISSIAGQLYQGIKRVNRDNSNPAKMYVFCSNHDAVDIVVQQLPNIQYVKAEVNIDEIRMQKETAVSKEASTYEQKQEEVKQTITEYRRLGVTSVKKKEIRERVGVQDKANFAKVLKALEQFFQENGIDNKGQTLVLK